MRKTTIEPAELRRRDTAKRAHRKQQMKILAPLGFREHAGFARLEGASHITVDLDNVIFESARDAAEWLWVADVELGRQRTASRIREAIGI